MTDQREALREDEHDGWRDMTDRELLSYAWSILSAAARELPKHRLVWAEVATAEGHLRRRLALLPSTPQPEGLDVERLARAWSNLIAEGGYAYGYTGVSLHVWREVAAEYARLAPPPPGTSDD